MLFFKPNFFYRIFLEEHHVPVVLIHHLQTVDHILWLASCCLTKHMTKKKQLRHWLLHRGGSGRRETFALQRHWPQTQSFLSSLAEPWRFHDDLTLCRHEPLAAWSNVRKRGMLARGWGRDGGWRWEEQEEEDMLATLSWVGRDAADTEAHAKVRLRGSMAWTLKSR